MGGECPTGWRFVFCLASASFWNPVNQPLFDNSWKLPALGAQTDTWTVSGNSGGGLQAANLQTVFSSKIKGAILIISKAYGDYFDWENEDPNNYEKCYDKAVKFAQWNAVDDTGNLKNQPVYIISGEQDKVVKPIKQQEQKDYFDKMGSNPILYSDANLWHGVPGIFYDANSNAPNWFDGYGNGFKHIFENALNGAESVTLLTSSDSANYENGGVLRKFSQWEFVDEFVGLEVDLDYYGYVWIPNACLSKSCKVHMRFHGCSGGISTIFQSGFRSILMEGTLQYGMSLDMIVIYPMAKVGWKNMKFCWNSNNHLQLQFPNLMNILGIVEPYLESTTTNHDIQNNAFLKMFERVSQPKDDSKYTYDDTVEINYLKKSAKEKIEVQKEINWNHIPELIWQNLNYWKSNDPSTWNFDKMLNMRW